MEYAYSRSVFFQTITHWALGLKTAKSRDRPEGLNPNVNALFLLFTLHFILLVGNIESNPGPHELSQSISENNHTETNRELCHYHLFGYQGVFQLQLIYRNHSKRFQGTPFYF
jgi:hypothetical protein